MLSRFLTMTGPMQFIGNVNTVGISHSDFSITSGSAIAAVKVTNSAEIAHRFRIIHSQFTISDADCYAVDVSASATIAAESYIIDACYFSGGATSYVTGVTQTDNKALFTVNRGISNTSVYGQMYMHDNVTATTISMTSTFVKVAGTTTAGALYRFTHTSNRLTNAATVGRTFIVHAVISFTTSNNNVCEFGIYDSSAGTVQVASHTRATANGSGRAENLSVVAIVQQETGDYIEVHCANITGTNNITVTDLTVIITELQ